MTQREQDEMREALEQLRRELERLNRRLRGARAVVRDVEACADKLRTLLGDPAG